MRLFLLNIVLAFAWCAAMGTLDVLTFGGGFMLAYGIILLARPLLGRSSYYRGLWRAVSFGGYYLWELLRSSLRVAGTVLSPRPRMRPGIIALPLDAHTAAEITVLANLITLTPGTLSLDVSADRRTLYVHAMYLDGTPDDLRREIKDGLERRVLHLMRGGR